MYNQAELEKKERRKIIVFSVVIVVLILTLVIAIVVAAINRSPSAPGGTGANGPVEIADDNTTKTGNSDNKQSTDTKVSTVSNNNKSTTVKTNETANANINNTNSSSSLPDTGPEDFLYSALVFGMLTTAGTACAMSYSTARKH